MQLSNRYRPASLNKAIENEDLGRIFLAREGCLIIRLLLVICVRAIRGGTPCAWSIVGGTLPDGLVFDSTTGRITGTPAVAGSVDLTFQVADALGGAAQKTLTLTIRQ